MTIPTAIDPITRCSDDRPVPGDDAAEECRHTRADLDLPIERIKATGRLLLEAHPLTDATMGHRHLPHFLSGAGSR